MKYYKNFEAGGYKEYTSESVRLKGGTKGYITKTSDGRYCLGKVTKDGDYIKIIESPGRCLHEVLSWFQ